GGGEGGIRMDLVGRAEAEKRLPILRERGIAAVTWSPTDCNVEPSELPIGYCRAAEKIGATLLPHTPAVGFEIGPRGVEAVRTPHGTIATRVVVDAAGRGRASSPRASARRCTPCRPATRSISPSRSHAWTPRFRSPRSTTRTSTCGTSAEV